MTKELIDLFGMVELEDLSQNSESATDSIAARTLKELDEKLYAEKQTVRNAFDTLKNEVAKAFKIDRFMLWLSYELTKQKSVYPWSKKGE